MCHALFGTHEFHPQLQYSCGKKPYSGNQGFFDAVRLSCKTAVSRSGPDETRTRDLRHAKAERRLRGRSLLFAKPLKQAKFANRPTTDVRRCSRGLSSNCRQLHARTSRMKGNFIQRSASLSDIVHVVLGTSVREAWERASGRPQACSMQDAAYGFRRISLLGTSVNKGKKRKGRRDPASLRFASGRNANIRLSRRLGAAPALSCRTSQRGLQQWHGLVCRSA
jgi:hypothetical protein